MMRQFSLARISGLFWVLGGHTLAFAPTSTFWSSSKLQQRQRQFGRILSTSTACQSCLSSELFLLSFDGTVAMTTDYRISQGIEVAFAAWPHLKELNVIAAGQKSSNSDNDNGSAGDDWLRNKMRALSHVLVARPGVSLSCDYALLARLIMEEQDLDQGRSNGSSGKYGSRFHPQQIPPATESSSSSSSLSSSSRRRTGSRPLTVGEIAANWNKGGCLADTVLTKYHINYKNPLPILQEKLEELAQTKRKRDLPKVNESVLDVLAHASGNIVITIGHESDLALAEETLSSVKESSALRGSRIVCVNDLQFENDLDDKTIQILPIQSSHASFYKKLLEQAPSGYTIYIFEGSWHALEQGIPLFGDNIPRVGSGMAGTILGRDLKLSLNFPAWLSMQSPQSSTSIETTNKRPSIGIPSGISSIQGDVTQQNEAMMNPWTNLFSEQDFAELLSARIVRSP